MGRGASFVCKTHRIRYKLGYGSYGTWMDNCKTVKEWDESDSEDNKELLKNQNIRKCLVEHEKCDFYYINEDVEELWPDSIQDHDQFIDLSRED